MAKRILIVIIVVGVGCGLIAVLSPHIRVSQPQTNNVANANVAVVECDRDSDCLVSGCSGTLCVPRDQAPGQYTTCEWQPEYACYAQDSCLCRSGRCQWAGNEGYAACIAGLK